VEYIYLTLTVETSIPTKTELLIALAQATQTNKKTAGVYSLLSVMQAAEHLGLTAWYVYQKIYSRQIAFHKIGGRIFIARPISMLTSPGAGSRLWAKRKQRGLPNDPVALAG
jgi:excisionase family DNA binding protein